MSYILHLPKLMLYAKLLISNSDCPKCVMLPLCFALEQEVYAVLQVHVLEHNIISKEHQKQDSTFSAKHMFFVSSKHSPYWTLLEVMKFTAAAGLQSCALICLGTKDRVLKPCSAWRCCMAVCAFISTPIIECHGHVLKHQTV